MSAVSIDHRGCFEPGESCPRSGTWGIYNGPDGTYTGDRQHVRQGDSFPPTPWGGGQCWRLIAADQ